MYVEGATTYTSFMSCSVTRNKTVTCTSNIEGVRSYIHVASGTVCESLTVRPQFELGDAATDYEHYGYRIPVTVSAGDTEESYNIYLDEPLRKVGDYADYLDFKNGKVVRKIRKIII